MALLRHFRTLKASSLVETVIAIAVISVCVMAAFLIYLNVVGQNHPVQYYEARHKVEVLAEEVAQQQDFNDDSFAFNGYTIEKHVELPKGEGVAFVTFTIESGSKRYDIKKVIPINHGKP